MTERMENALNHIKTSVDVDPWAIEVVEKVFRGVDDAIAEIETDMENVKNNSIYSHNDVDDGICIGLTMALDTIRKHTGVET